MAVTLHSRVSTLRLPAGSPSSCRLPRARRCRPRGPSVGTRVPTRTRRIRPAAIIVLTVVLASLAAALGWVAPGPSSRPRAHPGRLLATGDWQLTTHVIAANACSAEQIARLYGWTGDWRRYRYLVDQLNPGLHWGRLHPGDRLRVPDFRAVPGALRSASPRGGAAVPAAPGTPRYQRSARAQGRPARG
jgi:hypothetical protein